MYMDNIKNESFITLNESGDYHFGWFGNKIDSYPDIFIEIKNDSLQLDTILLPKIYMSIPITNPPSAPVYSECDELADGKIIDYYYDGSKYFEGEFENGYPIDILKIYYPSGNLKEITFDKNKFFTNIIYCENGMLKELREIKKRKYRAKSYYESGQLKKEEVYKKRDVTITEYYPDGQLKLLQEKKQQLRFHENGRLRDSIFVKEKDRFKVFFMRKFTMYKDRYFRVDWSSFGNLHYQVYYSDFEYNYSNITYPDSLEQIPTYLPDSILIYKDQQLFKKLSLDYELGKNGKYQKKLFLYVWKDEKWIEEEKYYTESKIYSLFRTHL